MIKKCNHIFDQLVFQKIEVKTMTLCHSIRHYRWWKVIYGPPSIHLHSHSWHHCNTFLSHSCLSPCWSYLHISTIAFTVLWLDLSGAVQASTGCNQLGTDTEAEADRLFPGIMTVRTVFCWVSIQSLQENDRKLRQN